MTRDDVRTWLAARAEGMPDSLAARIQAALDTDSIGAGADISDVLQRAADRLIREAAGSDDEAMTILTADALITYAVEARSERDPARLALGS